MGDASLLSDTPPASHRTGFLERLLDSLPDGLLLIREDRSIGYANQAFVTLWNVPSDLQIYRNDFALLNHVTNQLVDPYAFISEVERLYASHETSEDELHFKDGRILARRSLPVIDDQNGHGRLWIYTAVDSAAGMVRRPVEAAFQGAAPVSTDRNRKGLLQTMRDAMTGAASKPHS